MNEIVVGENGSQPTKKRDQFGLLLVRRRMASDSSIEREEGNQRKNPPRFCFVVSAPVQRNEQPHQRKKQKPRPIQLGASSKTTNSRRTSQPGSMYPGQTNNQPTQIYEECTNVSRKRPVRVTTISADRFNRSVAPLSLTRY